MSQPTQSQKLLASYIVSKLESVSGDYAVSSALATIKHAFQPAASSEIPAALIGEMDNFWNTKDEVKAEAAPSPVKSRASEHVPEKDAVPQDEKLQEFLDLLKVRGYFNGVEPDSEEYTLRLNKAIKKFHLKQNPYLNMTPEEIKAKGNAHMIAGNYNDAFECYTKAIEVAMQDADGSSNDESSNIHVYYANRAASLIELKKYTEATEDCEKSISYKADYPKAFTRLGVAFYYLNDFDKSASAYERALELDPTNEKYRSDANDARAKAKEAEAKAATPNFMQNLMGSEGGAGGANPFAMLNNPHMKEMMESMGNGGGMPDLSSAMAGMAGNPKFMEMAQSMMQNPQFSNMVQGFAQEFMKGGGAPGMPDFSAMDQMLNPTNAGVNPDALRELQEKEVMNNPKMRAISEDVKANGPAVFAKYMNDPDVAEVLKKFGNLFQKGGKPE